MSGRERIAKALGDHYYDASWSKERQGFRCVCGWLGEDHVQHVTDVIEPLIQERENTAAHEAQSAITPGWFG